MRNGNMPWCVNWKMCSGHGSCNNKKLMIGVESPCACKKGWVGKMCDTYLPEGLLGTWTVQHGEEKLALVLLAGKVLIVQPKAVIKAT